jgi:hypothetical protein
MKFCLERPTTASVAFKQAYWAALASGSSVLISENGNLVEIFPNGKQKFIKHLPPLYTGYSRTKTGNNKKMNNTIPRLRMFAGPNGSGKSTFKDIIRPELLGIYIDLRESRKNHSKRK